MNVNIITLGRLKESYFKAACAEYEKRLSAYCKLRITELEPDSKQNLEKEAVLINAKTPKSFKIALCSEGQKLTSGQLAKRILEAGTDLSFIIGSSEGLAESVKSSADLKLSLSDLTFPYQLARLMVTEQIYRALSINNNGKYHK
jgi:23S rRNA (pseudouridine1915-N3)-methyltransferase